MSWDNQQSQYGTPANTPAPYGGTPGGAPPAAYGPGNTSSYPYPPVSGYGMAPYLYGQSPRPFWKTFVFGLLLTLIPFVGAGMAVVYIYTRNRPNDYNAGEAALAGLMLFVFALIAAAAFLAVIGALGGLNR
ncbi:MAG: hypothetical protein QM692_25085 [Thermomicrobiales bacterium]